MPLHSAIFAFLHHLAAFGLVAVVFAQMILINGEITVANARRLQRLDMMLGLSASILLVVGLLRVFYFEKGSEYYFGNAFFLIKFVLFLVTGVLSIIPTLEFLSWRKATNSGEAPIVDAGRIRRVKLAIHMELLAIVLILLCAAMMARLIEIF